MAKQAKKSTGKGFSAAFRLSVIGFLAASAFLVWGFLQAGTLGMYRMGVRYPVLIVAAAGTVPVVIALVTGLLFRKKAKPEWLTAVLFVITVPALLFIVGLASFVFANSYGKPVDVSGRINIHNPLDGLPEKQGMRLFISSDPHVDAETSLALSVRQYCQWLKRNIRRQLDLFIIAW